MAETLVYQMISFDVIGVITKTKRHHLVMQAQG